MEKYMQLSSMESYYEHSVKKRMSPTTVSGLVLGLMSVVLVTAGTIWVSTTLLSWLFPLAFLMLGLGVYLIYYIIKNSRVEYEYTFVIGELRIARIKGKAKRKTITYFDVKSIDDIGKFINQETGKKNVDLNRFRLVLHAAVDDNRDDTYYMIIHDKVRRQPAVLLFTPDDRILEMIRPYFSVELKKKYIKLEKEEKDRKKALEKELNTDTASERKLAETETADKTESFSDKEIKKEKASAEKETKKEKASAEKETQKVSTDKENEKRAETKKTEAKKPAPKANSNNNQKGSNKGNGSKKKKGKK